MGIRLLLASIFFITLLLGAGFTYALVMLMKDRLFELFPAEVLPRANEALTILLLQEAIAIGIFAVVLLVVVYWMMSSLIVGPLKSIVKGMQAFAETGERPQLPNLSGTPTEIRTLASVFENFIDSVEQVHKHDVEISRVKSDFISTAAHQLRTPLTGIRWALEALEKENLTAEQQALVKSARDKSRDLVDTVGTLLDISSIESGKYKYTFAITDLTALIAEVAHDFAPLANQGQVALYYAKTESLPPVRVDLGRIKWILNNLIENAIRYTPSGGTVRISAEANDSLVLIRVHDTGIGIDEKDRDNIFQRFYRAGNAVTKQNQGNGLGLYIARTIATDHGGDLHFATNTEGPGTTFTLSLPIYRS